MMLKYNPISEKYKSKIGACSTSDNLILNVYSDMDFLDLNLRNDKTLEYKVFSFTKKNDYFTITLPKLDYGLYFYYFSSGDLIFKCNDDLYADINASNDFQLLVYDDDYKTPEWFKGGIMYQIFPDRFCSVDPNRIEGRKYKNWDEMVDYLPDEHGEILNNDFYLGNFKGIESKGQYLKSLGVTCIYLNPICLSNSNHRYNTSDYMKIDPLLGNEEDLKKLINKFKKLGIQIILDGVYNHTGDDSIYFNKYSNFGRDGAYLNEKSKYHNWYTFEEFPDKYTCWWGIKTLPTINKNCEEFENFITGDNGVLDYYLKMGVSGIRLDVVDELPGKFVKKIRDRIKKVNDENIVIGEVWEDATNKIAYDTRKEYFQGLELDSVMNYPLKNAIISFLKTKDSTELRRVMLSQINNYPKKALDSLMNVLSTHDTPRIFTVLGREFEGKTREELSKSFISSEKYDTIVLMLKMAFVINYFTYGVPCIYYGDEIAMQGEKDPFNRQTFKWENVGNDINKFVKKLGNIRNNSTTFVDGELNILLSGYGYYIFERLDKDNRYIIGVNLSEDQFYIKGDLYDLIGDKKNTEYFLNKNEFVVLKDLGYGH